MGTPTFSALLKNFSQADCDFGGNRRKITDPRSPNLRRGTLSSVGKTILLTTLENPDSLVLDSGPRYRSQDLRLQGNTLCDETLERKRTNLNV